MRFGFRFGVVVSLVVLYFVAIFGLSWFLMRAEKETFQAQKLSVADEARCMECMLYFQDVFQYTDPKQIVPYITKRGEYLTYVLRQFLEFVQHTVFECIRDTPEEKRTTKEVIYCFTNFVANLTDQCKQGGMSVSECSVIQKLSDKIIQQAMLCGTEACTVPVFIQRMEAEVKSMAQDILACKSAFETDASLCTQMYKNVMTAKNGEPKEEDDAAQDNRPVTQKELNKKMGEMTAFVMLNGG